MASIELDINNYAHCKPSQPYATDNGNCGAPSSSLVAIVSIDYIYAEILHSTIIIAIIGHTCSLIENFQILIIVKAKDLCLSVTFVAV